MITEHAPAPVTPGTGSHMTDIPLIELVQPMPGFPTLRQFALVQLDDEGLLCAFRSVEEPDSVPAASPRVRRSPSSWPPVQLR